MTEQRPFVTTQRRRIMFMQQQPVYGVHEQRIIRPKLSQQGYKDWDNYRHRGNKTVRDA